MQHSVILKVVFSFWFLVEGFSVRSLTGVQEGLRRSSDWVLEGFKVQAAKDKRWIDAMNKELQALEANHTWTLTLLPPDKKAIGCKWVYKIKFHSDGTIERYKARLVAQGFTQQEGIDYTETFAPVAKIVTVRTLLVVDVHHNWHIAQLDINNAFLHGDLHEEVYMSLPPGYTHTSTLSHQKGTDFLALLIYVDDILLTGNNIPLIQHFKKQLDLTFSIKDLGNLNYYLGIEFLRNSKGLTIAIVGKLLYLTITRPDLSYVAHALSQFSHSPRTPHWKALIKVLRYIKLCPGQGSSLISWQSKKQCVISRSSTEAEYRVVADCTCEITWLLSLLQDLQIQPPKPIPIYCDNQSSIDLASNPIQHARTKHIEIDCHFVREKIKSGHILPIFIPSIQQSNQLML
ncbi:retrovirus-related pol polyprotein from transposon RE1 [Tanacetum coccineum]